MRDDPSSPLALRVRRAVEGALHRADGSHAAPALAGIAALLLQRKDVSLVRVRNDSEAPLRMPARQASSTGRALVSHHRNWIGVIAPETKSDGALALYARRSADEPAFSAGDARLLYLVALCGFPRAFSTPLRSLLILSHQQVHIVALLTAGCSAAEIAQDLEVAPATVSTHVHDLYRRFGVQSRNELVDLVRDEFRVPDLGAKSKIALRLTPRQREILRLLGEGCSEKEVAARVGISRHTVHGHVKALHRRTGLTRTAELLALAE
jgi:DNA-binding CsgD family transcriptional regulator